MVGVGRNNNVEIKWDKEYLRDGDPLVTREKIFKLRYNKGNGDGAWRGRIDKNWVQISTPSFWIIVQVMYIV